MNRKAVIFVCLLTTLALIAVGARSQIPTTLRPTGQMISGATSDGVPTTVLTQGDGTLVTTAVLSGSISIGTVTQGTAAAANAPWSVRLSDGTNFYTGTKTGQLPTSLDGSGYLEVHEQGTATVSGTVTANAGTPLAGNATDKYATITTGGTSQTLIASNSSRKAFCVENDPAETTTLYVNFTSAATSGVGIALSPGGTFCPPVVTTQAITVNAANTGHVVRGYEQ